MGSRRPRPRHAPAPSRALTLVLFHERPHVPLLRAVRERAVPHILALAAVLRVDAELWAGREGSLLSPAGRCRCPSQRSSPPGAPRPQSEVPLPPRHPPGTHIVLLWEVANGRQGPHRHPLPLGLGHHQEDPPLLGPAAGQSGGWLGRAQGRAGAASFVGSPAPSSVALGGGREAHAAAWRQAYQCRALALQYLRSLSGSTTCPFLQHWPHTNFICRSKVPGPWVLGAPCREEGLVKPQAQAVCRTGSCWDH